MHRYRWKCPICCRLYQTESIFVGGNKHFIDSFCRQPVRCRENSYTSLNWFDTGRGPSRKKRTGEAANEWNVHVMLWLGTFPADNYPAVRNDCHSNIVTYSRLDSARVQSPNTWINQAQGAIYKTLTSAVNAKQWHAHHHLNKRAQN